MKTFSLRRTVSILLMCLGMFAGQTATAEQGEIVALSDPARIDSDGVRRVAVLGDHVVSGDYVTTGAGGQVQILLPDETKIVVGPNSQMKISDIVFKKNNVARRVSLNAVAGTFRFISGKSPKRAYSVRTPTATMAVRGTAFDFAVEKAEQGTALVVHDGIVRLCGSYKRCVAVPRGCQTVQIDRLRRFTQPQNRDERLGILRAMFPYATNDAQLEPLFRTFIEECKDDGKGGNKRGGTDQAQAIRQIELPADRTATPRERKKKTKVTAPTNSAPVNPAE